MENLIILGSTGSIGTQTLDVVRRHPEFFVCGLAAYRNIDLLEKQAREFHPKKVCVYLEEKAKELKDRLKDTDIFVLSGMDGLLELSSMTEGTILLGALVGMIGIAPTIEAISAGKKIAIANKETLVTAGHIILPLSKEKGVPLLPVDSEHSAIFQCLHGEKKGEVHRIILTASGGPFRGYTKEELRKVSAEDALKHPNWSMGPKVTIDSSTLVNKGLEVMEAHWLFEMPYEKIAVVIHPESIVHSMVEFNDGAVKAQLGIPDMKLPIQYALDYPNRKIKASEFLDFRTIRALHFEEPDTETFTGLKLAYKALAKGGNLPTVFNAANEWAVSKLLKHEISYYEIPEKIEWAMNRVSWKENPTLGEVLDTEKEVYEVLNCQHSSR